MNNIVLKEVRQELGTSGVKKLLFVLSGPHHNREVARDFNLTLWQVVVSEKFVIELCHIILEEESRPANILPFKQSKRNAA